MLDIFDELFEKDSYIVVGSFPLKIRSCKDIDVICYAKDIKVPVDNNDGYLAHFTYQDIKFEILLADNDKSLQGLLKNYQDKSLNQLQVCYILKGGHLHIAGKSQKNWEKHMNDFIILKDIVDTTQLQQYIKIHKKATDNRIKQRTPKLKGVKVNNFFDDNVKKYLPHDTYHEIIAHGNRPMYESMQLGDGTVECHKYLWDTFTELEKIQCVLEEAYVIAWERFLIPVYMGDSINIKTSKQAFDWALYRICTTLCSGWFREFAIHNYNKIQDNYNSKYEDIFFDNIFKSNKEVSI